MNQIVLDVEAGQITTELNRLGIGNSTRVHVLVQVLDTVELPMSQIADAGKGFVWLGSEPDLYSDADLIGRPR